MLRSACLALLVLGGVAACGRREGGGASALPSVRRPNVLVLVGDDVGAHLACYGVPGLATPRLDQLAREGARFTRAYAPTGICAPSRATLCTGLDPARHGALGFEPVRGDVATFGELCGAHGYRTGLIGKLGVRPPERFPFDWAERTLPGDEGARDLEFHLRAFEAFLAAGDGRPFALLVNFRDAHWPLPTDGAPARPGDASAPHDPAAVSVPPVLVDTPATRAELARYHDALRRLDATVGALLDVLAARDLAADTLVVFTSDNGPPFPRAKTTVYEWGLRQAFLVRWPGVVAPGRVDDRPVTLADVLPTLLDVAGAPTAAWAGLDGRSLLPLLRGDEEVPWRARTFGFHGAHRAGEEVPARSVREGRWKYVWNPFPEREFESLAMGVSVAWSELERAAAAGDLAARARVEGLRRRPPEELYDLERDPWELVDLAADPTHSETLARLRAALAERLAQQHDPLLPEWPH